LWTKGHEVIPGIELLLGIEIIGPASQQAYLHPWLAM